MPLDQGQLRWGGFLLDLATGFSEWLRRPEHAHVIHPVEQSNDVEIRPGAGSVVFRSGGVEGTLPMDEAILMVEDWLERLSEDIRSNAPEVLTIPGFDWARDRALGRPRRSGP